MDKTIFKKGEWVWYIGGYNPRGWYKVQKYDGHNIHFMGRDGNEAYAESHLFVRDPQAEIEPRPRRTVTMTEEKCSRMDGLTVTTVTFVLPVSAKNPRCLYEVME